MKRRITSILTAITCAICTMGGGQPLIVSAESRSDTLQYGEYLSYEQVDKDEDGIYDYVVITDCDESVTEIEIPGEIDGLAVTSIGSWAFSGCSSLSSITIPDSVTSIGNDAFLHCTSLESVTISDGVTSIGGEAFGGCTNLAGITIPDSVISVGYSAFDGSALLENQTGIKYADTWVVGCDSDVISAEIKNGTRGIAAMSFSGCSSLTEVIIPDGLVSIEKAAFSYCGNLEKLTIPDSVIKIGMNAFWGTKLPKKHEDTRVRYVDDWAIDCGEDRNSYIGIREGTKGIAAGAFNYCITPSSIKIPDTVVYINNSAFASSKELESIIIPESVVSVGDRAFAGCGSLESITFENPECEIYDTGFTISNGTEEDIPYFNGTIYGYDDSTAQKYAEKNGYKFESLGKVPAVTTPAVTTAVTTSKTSVATTDSEVSTTAKTTENTTNASTTAKTTVNTTESETDTTAGTTTSVNTTVSTVPTSDSDITTTPVTTQPTALNGDSNEDGKLNVRDAAFIASMIAKGKVNELPECADYNGDGKINVRDAAAIAKFLATGKR